MDTMSFELSWQNIYSSFTAIDEVLGIFHYLCLLHLTLIMNSSFVLSSKVILPTNFLFEYTCDYLDLLLLLILSLDPDIDLDLFVSLRIFDLVGLSYDSFK